MKYLILYYNINNIIAFTFTGQKYFHTKIFPDLFHIKLLIFKTFS